MIEHGQRAPDFELPGASGSDVDLYRLSESVDPGSVLLVFCPGERLERDPPPGDPVATAPWLQFLGGLQVWLVTDYRRPWKAARPMAPVPGVPILTDADGSLATEYGVEYRGEPNGSGITVVLVGSSRRVRLVATGEDAVGSGTVTELRRKAARIRSTPDGNQT